MSTAKLIRGGQVYAPDNLGQCDILIVGSQIIMIGPDIGTDHGLPDLEVIDATGRIVTPGLIDQHVHLIGGGGEKGYQSRTPELALADLVHGGITTVVGLLGTDGFARQLESLYAKTKALNAEGLTAFMHTGSYSLPSVTITGSVTRDIMFIDTVIGVKVAISDHRSSQAGLAELTRLTSEARVAGMLGGKPGMVHIHLGAGQQKLDLLVELVETSDIPIKQLMPTHVTRTLPLFEQAKDFAHRGGRIDITTISESVVAPVIKPSRAVVEAIAEGVPPEAITFSSDGNGSRPRFDADGNTVGMDIASVSTLHLTLHNLVTQMGWGFDRALPFFTVNPARALGLQERKGRLAAGYDADLLIVDEHLVIDTVIANGKLFMQEGNLVHKGYFD